MFIKIETLSLVKLRDFNKNFIMSKKVVTPTFSWSAPIQLPSETVYMVSQIKRNYVTLVLDVDDERNDEYLRSLPVILQLSRNESFSLCDKVRVRSYQNAKVGRDKFSQYSNIWR